MRMRIYLPVVGLMVSLLACALLIGRVVPDERVSAAHAARALGWSTELQSMVRVGFKADPLAKGGPPLVLLGAHPVHVSWFTHMVDPSIGSVSVPRTTPSVVLRYTEDDGTVSYYFVVDGEPSGWFGWRQFFAGVTSENPWTAAPQNTSI